MKPNGNITKNLPLSFENTNGNDGSGYEMETSISNSYTNNYITEHLYILRIE